jgi:VWFA-related protein
MKTRLCSFVLLLTGCCVVRLPAQAPGQGAVTFRSSTRLIVETVTVKDKNGRPIEGLTADDFTLSENGVPQAISFVEFQRFDATQRPPAATLVPQLPVAVADASPAVAKTIGASGDRSRYRDRRLTVFYFDLTSLSEADLLRAHDAARRFIATRMTAADLVGIITFKDGAVRVRQDFTDNPEVLQSVISDLLDDDKDRDGLPDPEPGMAFGQDDYEFNIFNTDRQLAGLQTAVTMLREVTAQKSLIYVASGLRLNGTDNQAQLRATINAALRANVVIHTIDARGLVAFGPMGDATRPSSGGIEMFTGQASNAVLMNLQRSQDALYALAKDTGGNAFLDSNDLSAGVVAAVEATSSYYLIGYYSTHTARDGRFRRVKVSLRSGLNAELTFRQGYFGDKEFAKFTQADKERQLEDALLLEDPITEITVAVEVNYFQLTRAEYFVPVSVKIPGSELALARRSGAKRTVIDFIGEVKDEYGHTHQNLRDKLDVALDNETAAQLATRPLQIESGFSLLPGRYTIKLLVRDAETGRMGTYQTTFVVPNLEKETDRLRVSSVVLSSQRVRLTESVYSVRQQTAAENANPLVADGEKLMPSITRVFSRRRDLYVFLHAYPRHRAAAQSLMAFVAFYKGDVKVFETPVHAIGAVTTATAVPVELTVPLTSMAPGTYECQVVVLDLEGKKASFWRAPVAIVP